MLVARPGHHAGGPGHQQARLGATWTTAGADEEGIAAALTAKGILSAAGSRSSRPSAVHFNNKNQTMVTVSGGVCDLRASPCHLLQACPVVTFCVCEIYPPFSFMTRGR